METVQLMELSSRECQKYLTEGGDLIFVPVGAVERLGPHLPVGAKNHVVFTVAEAMARKNKGYCLPVLPYAPLYDGYTAPGSVGVGSKLIHSYLYDLCKELVANGFRRIVVVSYCYEFYYLAHEFFQQENIPVTWASPDSITVKGTDDPSAKMTSLVAACVKLRGRQDLLERIFLENSKYFAKAGASGAQEYPAKNLRALGRIGYKYGSEEYEIQPVEKILIDEALLAIENWVEKMAPSVEALKEYGYYLSRSRFDRGLR